MTNTCQKSAMFAGKVVVIPGVQERLKYLSLFFLSLAADRLSIDTACSLPQLVVAGVKYHRTENS